MVYQFKSGFRCSVPAPVVGERIATIEAANGGHLTASHLVDDARPEDAPLHPCFEWDDSEAAERYREDQARHLIRSVYVVPDGRAESAPVLHHVHVKLPDVGNCYVTTARAVSDDELREQVEADALKAFHALRERYRHIQSLAPIFAAIDRLVVPRPAKKRGRPLAEAAR